MGKKSSKTKTTTTPWAPMQPYILGAARTSNDIVQQNQPQLNALAGDVRGLIPGLKDMIAGDQQNLAPAMGYANDVLGGKYLNSNPYMDDIVHQGEQAAGNAVNSTFSMAGRTGGGANQEALARGVANAGNQLRYQDYGAERDRMTQAAAFSPSLTAAQYAGYGPLLQAAGVGGSLPYAGMSGLNGLLGMGAGAGTTTGTQPGGWGTALLGAVGAGLPFIPGFGKSDRRLKKNIEKVGELADGVGLYEWDYREGRGLPDGRYRGVMADEIAQVMPWMLGPEIDGHMTVRYTPERIG